MNELFTEENKNFKQMVEKTGKNLSNSFQFFETAFKNGQELVIFVTELTANAHSATFISKYGCPEYFQHNKDLLFYVRQKELITEISKMEL